MELKEKFSTVQIMLFPSRSLRISFLIIIVFMILFMPVKSIFTQEIARTKDGRQVILYKNGTWKYKKNPAFALHTRNASFTRPANTDGFVQNKFNKYKIFYYKNRWTLEKKNDNKSSEFEFRHTDGDVYAMIIFERVQMKINVLRTTAIDNMKAVASEYEILDSHERKVNGKIFLYMKIRAIIKNISFIYDGYYYSGPEGTIQFLTFTSKNLYNTYNSDMQTLLNGLAIQK